MAGKGKLLENALRVAREGIESLSREGGKTPKELLSGFANQKPRVPFEEWRYEYEPTTELLPRKEFDPSQFRPGDVMIPLVGDRTSTGRKITSVAGEKLETPAITEGGPDYMRGPSQQADESVWASGKSVIPQLEGRINNALRASEAKGYKDPQVYGTYVAMGPQSGDFSTHTAETIMGMLPNAKIKRADVKEFDNAMREKFADWPGLMSKDAANYVVNAGAGEHRKTFLDAMDSAYWRDKGFPDVSLARYATTTPELVSAPTEAAGYNIARINPGVKPEIITTPHRSYPLTMHGEYVGGLPEGLSRDDVFTQFSRGFDADPPARNYVMAKRRSFGMDPNAFQVMDEPEIEALIRKTEALKRGYADGGEVDDDIHHAIRLARAEGGDTPQVFLTDAQGRQYDAQGKPIQPVATQEQSNSAAQTTPEPQRENINTKFNVAPQNYYSDVQPFIDYAVTPVDRAGMPSDPDLVDVMRIATKVAAEGQPTETRGEGNLARRREEFINNLYGADPDRPDSPSSNQAWIANRVVDFSPWALGEVAHDIPYEAGRTGDYGTAAIEGGVNAALTAPVLGAAGRGIKKGYEYAKKFPLIPATAAGVAGLTGSSDEAEAGPARWFSKAMEVAGALPMEKMTGQQALAMLRKSVSPEELRWTGTDAFLSSRPQVSKGELLKHLQDNRVQLNEITLGGEKPSSIGEIEAKDIPSEIRDKYMPDYDKLLGNKLALDKRIGEIKATGNYIGNPEYIKLMESRNNIYKSMGELSTAMRQEYADSIGGLAKPTKYQTWSTGGGKGYQENLYQYGNFPRPSVVQKNDGMWHIVDSNGDTMRNSNGGPYTYYDKMDAQRAAKSIYRDAGKYRSSHWDDPNVSFHTRSQSLEYTPPGANRPYKVHNVDETQSDWGQDARKRGFKPENYDQRIKEANQKFSDLMTRFVDEEKKINEELFAKARPYKQENKRADEAAKEMWRRNEITGGDYHRMMNENYEKFQESVQDFAAEARAKRKQILDPLQEEINQHNKYIASLRDSVNGVPEAPFITSTEGWTDRSIKQELDRALDNGSDYFSWTPGDVQADRFSLDKHIEGLAYDASTQTLNYKPMGSSGYGWEILAEEVPPEKLKNYVGKDVADKLLSTPRDEDETHTLMGLDLKTGGEGMRNYYNNIYAKRVQDVLKRATGEKPNIEVIEVQTADGPRKHLGIRLTDEMREKARFSDFNKGGRVTGGNTYDNDPSIAHALALTSEY